MRKIMTVFAVGAMLIGLSNFAPAKAETEGASTVATQADVGSTDVPAAVDEKIDEAAKGDENAEPSNKKEEKNDEPAKTGKTDKTDEKAVKAEKKEEQTEKKTETGKGDTKQIDAKKDAAKEETADAPKKGAKSDESAKTGKKDETGKGDKKEEAKKEEPAKVEPKAAAGEAPEKIMFENNGKMAPVAFPHKLHGEKNACKDCHEGDKPLFEKKITKTGFKMVDMYAGKYCGACHDGKKVVGTVTVFEAKKSCVKCHVKK